MTTATYPEHATVTAEIRLFFGPEIEDDEIEFAVRLALEDLRVLVAPDHLLESARRLAMVRLDSAARATRRSLARRERQGSGRMP
ncbi:MAG TPA: hypothetical protein VGH43_02970 [Jatrophihabitans sp.]